MEMLIEGFARWGIAETLGSMRGHVRAGAVGPAAAMPDPGPRPARHQAAVLEPPGGLFFFPSELKALHCHPDWRPAIDRDAVAAFLRTAPASIYRDTHKLTPCAILTIDLGGVRSRSIATGDSPTSPRQSYARLRRGTMTSA
jgi:hypothetical protein